jgi:5'-nucleotidase
MATSKELFKFEKMKNIVISNPEKFAKLLKVFKEEGKDRIHILSDFDRTLTKAYINGKFVPSIISQLRDGNYLIPDYAPKAQALYDKYHAIEIDPRVGKEEKAAKMYEWWVTHFGLLIKSGLNKKDLEKVVQTGPVELRNGTTEFLDLLYKNNIPLIILSSSGIGDAISLYFKKINRLYDNIYVISNFFEWDEDGHAIKVKEPIIHSLNKSEITLKNYPIYNKIKDRKNVIQICDTLDDIEMVEGFEYNNLLNIGFLNEEVEVNLEIYKKNFDIVITNDSNMDFIVKLMQEIL